MSNCHEPVIELEKYTQKRLGEKSQTQLPYLASSFSPIRGAIAGRILALAAAVALASCAVTERTPAIGEQGPEIEKPAGAGEVITLDRRDASPEHALDVERYPTREERMRAEPLDWEATRGEPGPLPDKSVIEDPALRDERDVRGGEPEPNANEEARRSFPKEWRGIADGQRQGSLRGFDAPEGAMFILTGTKDVYAQYSEPSTTVYPRRAIGKLFTNQGTCSASVVSGNNVIVTAAHCCYDRGRRDWIGGWSFAPAYDNGNAPYGMFGWRSATILTSWITNGTRASDVCAIRLRNNAANRPVTFYTGWLGRSWNYSSLQALHALGYPGNIGGGQTLELCSAESFSPNIFCGGSGVLNMGCKMTFGSSGGPWIRSYRGSNWVNAVVSGYDNSTCTGTFGETFNGPRFTSGNIVPICNAIGC